MATFVKEHNPADFTEILAELTRKKLPNNFDRWVAGVGRSQAFGLIRRWSYRPWISRNTWMRPELWAALLNFANLHVTVPWDAIQVNDNYASKPHRDRGNQGESYIVGFGDYTGGNLNVEGTSHNIRHRGYTFNGANLLHHTEEWTGHRYSLVFFCIEWPRKFQPGYAVSSRMVEDGLEITDSYDNSILVLNRRGKIVRIVRAPIPKPWVGHLTVRGQKSGQVLQPTSEDGLGI